MTGVIAPLGVRQGGLVCSAVCFASLRLCVRQGPVVCSAAFGLNRTHEMDGTWRIACTRSIVWGPLHIPYVSECPAVSFASWRLCVRQGPVVCSAVFLASLRLCVRHGWLVCSAVLGLNHNHGMDGAWWIACGRSFEWGPLHIPYVSECPAVFLASWRETWVVGMFRGLWVEPHA
jgi:hypothetical protein